MISVNAGRVSCGLEDCTFPASAFNEGTYVIGKYVFSTMRDTDLEELVFGQTLENRVYDGRLTGRHIMLAATSIEGEFSWMPVNLLDMKIIEKVENGWIDPFSGEEVEVPEIIPFKYYDMLPVGNVTINEEIDTPILTKTSIIGYGSTNPNDFSELDQFAELGYETPSSILLTITSVENVDYYELASSYSEKGIYKLEATSIDEELYGDFKEGETKFFKARACKRGNQYGDECGLWSNIVLLNEELDEPDFTNLGMSYDEETGILTSVLKVGLEYTAIDGVEIFSSKERYNTASYKLFKDLEIENRLEFRKVNSAYDETHDEITAEQIYEQNLTRCYDETESFPCYYEERIQTGGNFDFDLEIGEYAYYRARSYKIINGRRVYSSFTPSELFANEIVDSTVVPTIELTGDSGYSISQVENALEYYIYVSNSERDLTKLYERIDAENFENGQFSFGMTDSTAVDLLYGDSDDRLNKYDINVNLAPFDVYVVARLGDVDDPYTISAPSNVYKQGIQDVPEISVVNHTGEEGYLTDVNGNSYCIDEDGKYTYEFKINASDFAIEDSSPTAYEYSGYYIGSTESGYIYVKKDMTDTYIFRSEPGQSYTLKAYLYSDEYGISISNLATINIHTNTIN